MKVCKGRRRRGRGRRRGREFLAILLACFYFRQGGICTANIFQSISALRSYKSFILNFVTQTVATNGSCLCSFELMGQKETFLLLLLASSFFQPTCLGWRSANLYLSFQSSHSNSPRQLVFDENESFYPVHLNVKRRQAGEKKIIDRNYFEF